MFSTISILAFPGGSVVKNQSPCEFRSHRFDPWVGKIPWRRKWQLTSVFLPGKSHGQRSLVGYSPWVTKSWTELKWLSMHSCTCTHTHICILYKQIYIYTHTHIHVPIHIHTCVCVCVCVCIYIYIWQREKVGSYFQVRDKSESVSCSVVSDSLWPPRTVASVHRILQPRILEWVIILFSRASPSPGIDPGSPEL